MAMTPKVIAIPEKLAIYRGSEWQLRIDWTWDVSGKTFTFKIGPAKNTNTGLVTNTADNSHNGDEDAYSTFTISAANTAGIATSIDSLFWDVRDGNGNTYFEGTVGVRGQVGAAA